MRYDLTNGAGEHITTTYDLESALADLWQRAQISLSRLLHTGEPLETTLQLTPRSQRQEFFIRVTIGSERPPTE